MSTTDIFQAALALPYEVRSQLAQQLFDSLTPPGEDVSPEEWEESWAEEIDRRIQLREAGETESLSVEEAHERVLRHLADKNSAFVDGRRGTVAQ